MHPAAGVVDERLGMKEANMPCDMATSWMVVRNAMIESAIVIASAYRRSISFCPGPDSWWENSTGMFIDSSAATASLLKSCAADLAEWSKYPARSIGWKSEFGSLLGWKR